MRMDERKNAVLQAIVDDYIATAEPVGSRTIARKYQLGVSPATIRNEMADLEELGFLAQPHTSAGRIPSDRGYRYYVDCLMEHRGTTPQEEEIIRRAFERRAREIDVLVRETARILSETTHYTSLVTGPQLAQAAFRQLQLVPMEGDRALLVYVTDTGFVENQVIDLPVEITMVELQRISHVLTERLRGTPVEKLSRQSIQQLQNELIRYSSLLEQTLDFLGRGMAPGEKQRVYLGGTTNILSQPEFKDVDKVRSLFQVLEQEDVVTNVLTEGAGERGVHVTIGEELSVREMHDCSMVSATYSVGDRTIGRIGVIGPKRMEYAKVVSVVESVTERLAERMGQQIK